MLDTQTALIASAIFLAFLAGKLGSRWRLGPSKPFRRRWTRRAPPTRPVLIANAQRPSDSADQLRSVMQASFERQKLLSRPEARVFQQVERAALAAGLGWRVMAQVSLGEVLRSADARAYAAINSKRVDILLISSAGDPLAAIEYQGSGHHQGTAAARDAVKREALRRAGVAFIEILPDHTEDDVSREVLRLAGATAVA